MSCDCCQPGGKFFRIAHAPARLPRLNQRVLHDILRFLAVLQNAVSDGEKCPAVRANNHVECLPIAVNGRPVLFTFASIHWVDLKLRRLKPRFRAKIFWQSLPKVGRPAAAGRGRQTAEGANITPHIRITWPRVEPPSPRCGVPRENALT